MLLDGAMGTMIQRHNLTEDDYRKGLFAHCDRPLKGNYEALNLTRPDIITDIHRQYYEAGADIVTTNTLNCTAISMDDYGIGSFVAEMNRAAVACARRAADECQSQHPDRQLFVAGSVGPTGKTASISPDVNNPAYRAVTYGELYNAYYEQIMALIEGGVDILLFETIFDTLNVKAALDAGVRAMRDKSAELPVMLSLTLSGKGGRSFSGQTLEAFVASVSHAPLLSIGLNCSFGAADIKPFLRELASFASYYISVYPNAGLPNQFGEYDETPEMMAQQMKSFIDEGLVNIVGGCCGTTPEHIALFHKLISGAAPHTPVAQSNTLILSGLETLEVKPENNFINIGERCNVAGSRKFLRLIKEKNYDEALTIARCQVEDGAQVIDINMDDGLIDAEMEMTTFLNLIASEPDIARVPVMIDSSKWSVIEAALQCVQGKSIVNSISLKEGEATFLQHAARIRQLGAAVIVMAFDEKGQADTYGRKIEVCQRAYNLLVSNGFPPQDIIFDPNVLAIATGMTEHNGYAHDFIRAVGWIKRNLPYAKVSGGVSNLSFSFRGNNYVREAMHSVFLYHAIREGLDMGIVNPSESVIYEDIEPTFRNLLEDVILARRSDAVDELISYASSRSENGTVERLNGADIAWRSLSLDGRLEHALVKGIMDYLEEDLAEALKIYGRAVEIIDKPLMTGMNKVGALFGAGKMFLPQVVKTARTMKKAVAILQPAIEAERSVVSESSRAGKIVFATVKGDVHDIGKNICSIVLNCNNYEVVDLGVMVPSERILDAVRNENADILCLSGLITPSLEEMVHVVSELEKAGINVPVMIGGATTSKLHTALKIAPHYSHPVVYAADASQSPMIAAKLLNKTGYETFMSELKTEYARLRDVYEASAQTQKLVSLTEARTRRFRDTPSQQGAKRPVAVPNILATKYLRLSVCDLVPYINWTFFYSAWKLNGREGNAEKMQEAQKLFNDAQDILYKDFINHVCHGIFGLFPAYSENDNIHIGDEVFPMLRQQKPDEHGICYSLADFVEPENDYAGLFGVSIGEDLNRRIQAESDSYRRLLMQTIADRLAEAAAEFMHELVRKQFWGYAKDESLSIEDMLKDRYQGIRPAAGYPSLPDQTLIFKLDKLLNLSKTGITLTENGAMTPTASVAGMYIAHPQSKYFMIGKITDEQLHDYARRRDMTADELRKYLISNLTN